ncbi:MAG: arylsulfatase [Planctomycetota bacterium]
MFLHRSVFALTVAVACPAVASAATPPNIIFILADDVAMGDLGSYGQELIETPHLDRMAAEGTRYTSAYAGTSVCAPSRSSLMTGLDMGRCPVRANWEIKPEGQLPLPEGTVTVAGILKEAGYRTACMGKWGMGMFDTSGSPLAAGFDHFYGYNCQRHAHTYFPDFLYDDAERFDLEEGAYAGDMIQDEVEDWVRSAAGGPFFLFYSTTLPHGRYEIDDTRQYADREGWTEKEKTYAAMVSRLDEHVGRLLDLLAELGVDDNTLVMFSGDNGSSFDDNSDIARTFDQSMGGKLRGFKRGMYEGGLRQAALARWPGVVPAGRVTDGPWAFWDFLPTAVELAGATSPEGYESSGLSLVDFLKGADAPVREAFYFELQFYNRGKGRAYKANQAVRFGDWKAVRNRRGGPVELYDLGSDLGETRDLAASRPDLVERAVALMASARDDNPRWPDPALPPRAEDRPKPSNKSKGKASSKAGA